MVDHTELGESGWRPALGNVLVATDFSPGAAHAVARAVRLPITPGSAVNILHVLPGVPEAGTEVATRRALDRAAGAARTGAREAGLTDVEVKARMVYDTAQLEALIGSELQESGTACCGGAGDDLAKRWAPKLQGKVASVKVAARRPGP